MQAAANPKSHFLIRPRLVAYKRSLATQMRCMYKVTFKTPEGQQATIECPKDQYILDAAEAAGLELPITCTAGGCSECVGRLQRGTLDQSDQKVLDEEQISQGFAMLCTSYPTSDCEILIQSGPLMA